MNDYEKVFLDKVSELKIDGPTFSALVRQSLEAEYGGEIDTVLSSLDEESLENPKKVAAELYKTFGNDVMRYFVTILKYAESGKFQPQTDSELEEEEQTLASLVRDTEADSGNDSATET